MTRADRIRRFASDLATRAVSAGKTTDTKWTGYHNLSLATHLACAANELTENDIACAADAYAQVTR